jgi:nucleoside-diphosphate-sugar epimerase
MRDRVLITGATGFLGGHLAAVLVGDPRVAQVFCLTRPERPRPDFLQHAKVTRLEGPLSAPDLPGTGGLVLHCAAERSPRSPRLWETNHLATRALSARAAQRGWSFIYASSQSVYGAPSLLPVPETALPEPTTEYGRSKLAGEEAVGEAYAAGGGDYAVLRLARLYGTVQTARYDGALGQFVQAARSGTPATIHGAGAGLIDLLHIRDAVRAVLAAADRLSEVNGVLNVGSGAPLTILALAETVRSVCPNFAWELDTAAAEGPGLWLETQRIRDLLGWEASASLADDLRGALG